jgi:hypothetical protein
MKISFMVIVFIVITLDIRLQIAGLMEEMFKQEMIMWPHIKLHVTNSTTMVILIGIVESWKCHQ